MPEHLRQVHPAYSRTMAHGYPRLRHGLPEEAVARRMRGSPPKSERFRLLGTERASAADGDRLLVPLDDVYGPAQGVVLMGHCVQYGFLQGSRPVRADRALNLSARLDGPVSDRGGSLHRRKQHGPFERPGIGYRAVHVQAAPAYADGIRQHTLRGLPQEYHRGHSNLPSLQHTGLRQEHSGIPVVDLVRLLGKAQGVFGSQSPNGAGIEASDVGFSHDVPGPVLVRPDAAHGPV